MFLYFIAAVAAYFVKGLCGFANTLVFTSILSFGTANVSISPMELILGYPANLLIAFRERRHLKVSLFGPLIICVLIGCIPGALVLAHGSPDSIRIFFGLVIIALASKMLINEVNKPKAQQKQLSKTVFLLSGLLSGILAGMFGVGALLGVVLSRTADDPETFRGNLSLIFFAENTFRIFLYIRLGILTGSSLVFAAKLMPFMLLGLYGGVAAGRILPDRRIKFLVMILLILSGAALVLQSLHL